MPNEYATTAGTHILYDDLGTADPTTALAKIDQINGMPVQEVDEFETTRVDQEVSGGGAHDWFKQFAPDHIDPGMLELKLAFTGAGLETLYGLVRQFKSWKILFSDGSKLVFDAYVKRVGPEAQVGDEVLIDVQIRVSGKPTFTKYVAA